MAKKKIGVFGFIGLGVLGLVVLFVLYLGIIAIYGATYTAKFDAHIVNDSGVIVAKGKSLYDKDGNPFVMVGTNAGCLFVPEGWMTIYSIGRNDANDGYKETPEQNVIDALKTNANNFTDAQIENIWKTYYENWWTDDDFDAVKNLGMNTIRLPFTYTMLMEGVDDQHLAMKEDAFKWLDWFLSGCASHQLYCVLDLHCAPGGQSFYEHSGNVEQCELFSNEIYQQETCLLWQSIATHYTSERSDLGAWIAAYDTFNEPAGTTYATGEDEWLVMDKVYDAIRQVDENHVVCFEGCWTFANLPNPARFGWKNVMFEFHWYNWSDPKLPSWLFRLYEDLSLPFNNFDVPFYMGEFNFFDNNGDDYWQPLWKSYLDMFRRRNMSWTTWSAKVATEGWWGSSWGLLNYKMNLSDGQYKVDLSTATYAEIISAFDALDEVNWEKGPLSDFLKDYIAANYD